MRLADNVREETRIEGTGEDAVEQTMFVYDEVEFDLEPEREETAADIEADFEGWWEFGSQEEIAEPTLEERISAIEDYLLGEV